MPPSGRVGFFCQSGALGTAILANAAGWGLGLSRRETDRVYDEIVAFAEQRIDDGDVAGRQEADNDLRADLRSTAHR